ncbi:MAG TPA: hypothetical protein VKU03_03955 [Roseiarcus sp.]|nr:hypothetical protein [Roseiarcus sp.]
MPYLALNPMIAALRERPEDFDLNRGWLTHFPSGHRFKFDRAGNVSLRANCDCALLSVRQEEGQELWQAFESWRANYWRPIEINREFAAHFRRPNVAQRMFRWILRRIRAVLLDPSLDAPSADANAEAGRIAHV